MNVFANGVQKCGNHALEKACDLLGVLAPVNHLPWEQRAETFPDGLPEKALFIKRDPRNALLSWIRARNWPVTQGTVIAAMGNFADGDIVATFDAYAGWFDVSHVVAFEDLIYNDAAMRGIAEYLGVPYLDDAFPNLPGHTVTWTGRYSDFRSVWSPIVEQAWQEHGGNELLARWGYAAWIN